MLRRKWLMASSQLKTLWRTDRRCCEWSIDAKVCAPGCRRCFHRVSVHNFSFADMSYQCRRNYYTRRPRPPLHMKNSVKSFSRTHHGKLAQRTRTRTDESDELKSFRLSHSRRALQTQSIFIGSSLSGCAGLTC